MPGIAGIIRAHPYDGIRRDLRFMVDAMRHEEFYEGGEYVNEELGFYSGWMGQKGTFADCMPLIAPNKEIAILFYGENYLDRDTRSILGSCCEKVDESNARYLLRLYSLFGEGFLRRLNGWFCGIIVNLRERTISVFNDRYGMGRLYFYEGKDEFLFASEAKCLLKIRPELRTMDPAAIAQYLRCGCVLSNKTFFKNLAILPQGSSWTFINATIVRKNRYFTFREWEQQATLPSKDLYEQFKEVVSAVVPRYTNGSQKVGMSLTAGLDTRLIMASLEACRQEIPCYTFGGPWGETFDIRTARKIAKIAKQRHDVIRIGEQFFREFPSFVRRTVYLSDGTHDAFGAHDLFFNRLAREIAPVRLTGKFGSEVVRVRRMIPWENFPRDLLNPDLGKFLDEAPSFSQVSQAKNPLSGAVSEEIPWYEFGRVAIEQSQVVLRTPYMDNELVKLMFQASFGLRKGGQLQAQYVRDKCPALDAILTNLSRSGTHNRVIKELLYIGFWSLFKLEYIYLFATPHWVTRIDRKLEKLRPERFLSGRQKFEAYRIWIRSYLADFIRETLQNRDAQFANFFQRKSVLQMVDRHLAGTHNYLNEINKVLTVELICCSLLKK